MIIFIVFLEVHTSSIFYLRSSRYVYIVFCLSITLKPTLPAGTLFMGAVCRRCAFPSTLPPSRLSAPCFGHRGPLTRLYANSRFLSFVSCSEGGNLVTFRRPGKVEIGDNQVIKRSGYRAGKNSRA